MNLNTDRQQLDEIFSLAYEELRRLARSVLRSDWAAKLTPTTLVNEAWIKLAHSPQVAQTSPLHFRRIAARAMRQVLVEVSRRNLAQIRGAGMQPITFDDSLDAAHPIHLGREILALDAALDALGKLSPRQAALVEGRFFGGLSCSESASALGISEATVMREWRVARAWLSRQVRRSLQLEDVADCFPDAG